MTLRSALLAGSFLATASAMSLKQKEILHKSSYVRIESKLLFRGNKRGVERTCGQTNKDGYLNVTPDETRAMHYTITGMNQWEFIKSHFEQKDVQDQQSFDSKVREDDYWLQMMGDVEAMDVEEPLFPVTEDSLAMLFADREFADTVQTFVWTTMNGTPREEKCTRANMVRLCFLSKDKDFLLDNCQKPQSALNLDTKFENIRQFDTEYLYPATSVLQKIENAQGWSFSEFSKKPEYLLWKSMEERCTKRSVWSVYNEPTDARMEAFKKGLFAKTKDTKNFLYIRKRK